MEGLFCIKVFIEGKGFLIAYCASMTSWHPFELNGCWCVVGLVWEAWIMERTSPHHWLYYLSCSILLDLWRNLFPNKFWNSLPQYGLEKTCPIILNREALSPWSTNSWKGLPFIDWNLKRFSPTWSILEVIYPLINQFLKWFALD